MTISSRNMDQEEDRRPRYMVFSKMEKIIRDMQHNDTGITVRCQKIFLTTIPCAFSGYDLVEWLMDNLDIDECMEALHTASLLCQYGYFFPVADTKSLTVKDDGTLYRFQSPYFWPSQNWAPDNVDYAIYLAKRSMRNKQRHGLEEYEQAALNKLQKMLCDKWDFIYMQAEEQVRLAKDRKKADKVVLDSQERAFWRVHRPPPGHIKYLEEGVHRNFKPSQMTQRKKKNMEGYKKEVEFLNRCLQQPRMKLSKAVESLIQRCELYEEHDPFLVQPQPSNPWISDDNTMWMLNTVLVDTPTERRVKRWGFSLWELLADATGRHEFETFLEKEYSSENIHFWWAVQELKRCPLSQVPGHVQDIYQEYLAPGAPCEINIDSRTMEDTLQAMKTPSRFTFDIAQGHIFLLMKKDSYQRFLRSEDYKHLLATAINPCPRKKFFNFVGRRSKSPNPSPKPKRRGSTSSAGYMDKTITTATLSQHSYSTGNLQDLDDKSSKSTPCGSNSDVRSSAEEPDQKSLSPQILRRQLDELVSADERTAHNHCNAHKISLEVPNQFPAYSHDVDSDDDNMIANLSVKIAVPNTKPNIVAPWETEEIRE